MKVTNGEITTELPEPLAEILLRNKGWKKSGRGRISEQVVARVEEDETPIPMTHIPGVVPGVSMKKVQALVKSGTVPVTVKDRKKLVRPSDVIAALK